jgi:hypothetical protein
MQDDPITSSMHTEWWLLNQSSFHCCFRKVAMHTRCCKTWYECHECHNEKENHEMVFSDKLVSESTSPPAVAALTVMSFRLIDNGGNAWAGRGIGRVCPKVGEGISLSSYSHDPLGIARHTPYPPRPPVFGVRKRTAVTLGGQVAR